jgi:hypothetical protein
VEENQRLYIWHCLFVFFLSGNILYIDGIREKFLILIICFNNDLQPQWLQYLRNRQRTREEIMNDIRPTTFSIRHMVHQMHGQNQRLFGHPQQPNHGENEVNI